jgi:hypothetical protein
MVVNSQQIKFGNLLVLLKFTTTQTYKPIIIT